MVIHRISLTLRDHPNRSVLENLRQSFYWAVTRRLTSSRVIYSCWCILLRSPTSRATLKHMAMVEEAVEHGGHRSSVAQQFSPVLHTAIHLFVEIKIEVIQRLLRISELCLLSSALQQVLTAARE